MEAKNEIIEAWKDELMTLQKETLVDMYMDAYAKAMELSNELNLALKYQSMNKKRKLYDLN